ncbi:hypothetical protein F5Y06DRAFT_294020 [Hypoxylon sp. FL0890]|nr:hypothetical protein F5Y06DRAFT_294020 [Hypoxylon sp. FL0890]
MPGIKLVKTSYQVLLLLVSRASRCFRSVSSSLFWDVSAVKPGDPGDYISMAHGIVNVSFKADLVFRAAKEASYNKTSRKGLSNFGKARVCVEENVRGAAYCIGQCQGDNNVLSAL